MLDDDGIWHSGLLRNSELAAADLRITAAELAETFDESVWGDDAGRSFTLPLLERCKDGEMPSSVTLVRACLYTQSRSVRLITQDYDAPEEVALLDRLAQAVRDRVALNDLDDEATVIARCLSLPDLPLTGSAYEDPAARPERSLLLGLMSQPTSLSQQPIENQLTEVVAFLLDRSDAFARGFVGLGDARDGDLRDAVANAGQIGARTRISLPAPGPSGLPQRTTLFPDLSIDGSNLAFQVLVEAKVDAELHRTTMSGETFPAARRLRSRVAAPRRDGDTKDPSRLDADPRTGRSGCQRHLAASVSDLAGCRRSRHVARLRERRP